MGFRWGINKLLGTLPSIASFWGEFYPRFVTLVSEQLDPWRRPSLGLSEVGRLPPVLTGLSEGSLAAVVVGSEEGGFVMITVQGRLQVQSDVANPPLASRSFWKVGNYDVGPTKWAPDQGQLEHAHVHPKFLHSIATSHKWAFGAIAELLDNAVMR
ncbi:histidine kinase-, DNA gyrase B-, and HSP90-like ATPase family protein [Actinidia rufa]|uniref:Histidine kinase-, DNA gyrase B-, and HSP90-like ATPase family protein n=1 Tax=Actinidia rufa TaxID=165716 RepID=A0A7J0ENA0_9ERIC|nr:histidine kinase-, DNA gyrase B-, and HSP90-like ATPase family protein [Actinidia rufa]